MLLYGCVASNENEMKMKMLLYDCVASNENADMAVMI